jgi:uncharacterized protein (TIGR03545 family)
MTKRAMKRRYWILSIPLVLIGAYWLFSDALFKSITEAQLSQTYGAEVNIGEFKHTLFPLSLEIKNIQITDPQRPTTNQVVIGELAGDIEFIPLFSNQFIMNKVALLDVAFAQPRATAGEVFHIPEQSFNFDDLLASSQEALPDVDDLLAKSPLKTTQAVADAQQTYATYSDSLEAEYQKLPNKERLNYYKTQLKQLQDTDYKDPAALLKAKEAFDALKKEIANDQLLVTNFTTQASQAKTALADNLRQLKQAQQDDYALLQGAFAGDQAALAQLTQVVFGDKAAEYNQYLLSAFQLIVPMLTGGTDDAEEVETGNAFMVLVRQANVSINWQEQLLTSDWLNITNAHDFIGQPTTFTLNAVGNALKQFATEGQFYIDSEGIDAAQTWQLAGVALDQITLSDDPRLDAAIKHAILDSSGSLTIENSQLTGTSTVDLADLAISATGNDDITGTIANLLDDLDALTMNIDLAGSFLAPDFHISSDLDNRLAQAALTELSASQQDKLTELNQKLTAMTSSQQDQLTGELSNVSALLDAAQGDSETLNALAKEQLDNLVDKQKDKLFQKLTDKLNGS